MVSQSFNHNAESYWMPSWLTVHTKHDELAEQQTDAHPQAEEEMCNTGNYRTTRAGLNRYERESPRVVMSEQRHQVSGELPERVRLLSGNIAGAADPSHLAERMDHIELNNADIVLLQEVNAEVPPAAVLAYPYRSTLPSCRSANSDVQLMILSMHPWDSIEYVALPGVLHYDNAVIFARFGALMVVNVYLQSGSVLSGAIEPHLLHHFHECRKQALEFISQKVLADDCTQVIIAGDFNADWNSTALEWPELEVMRTLGATDVMSPKAGADPVFTEDSETNMIRKAKGVRKQVRFDTALCTGVECVDAQIIWTEPFELRSEPGRMWHPSDHAAVQIDLVIPRQCNESHPVQPPHMSAALSLRQPSDSCTTMCRAGHDSPTLTPCRLLLPTTSQPIGNWLAKL